MAITKANSKLKVQVFVNGAPLEEHVDDDEETSDVQVTRYIEASSGDNFEIRYSFAPGFSIRHDIRLSVRIDGKAAGGVVFYSGFPVRWDYVYTMKGRREFEDGQYFTRKFCFSKLETDDGDLPAFDDSLKKKLKNVGVISARFTWVKASVPSTPSNIPYDDKNLGVVPEKALKGSTLSHQASFGPREVGQAFDCITTTKVYDLPFAEFKFRYRSKAALQSLLIIPRSPSPVPLEDRDVDTLTAEESRELIRRLRERDRAAQPIKREGIKRERSHTIADDEDDGDDVSFVSEKRRRLPVTLDENGVEIVDLT